MELLVGQVLKSADRDEHFWRFDFARGYGMNVYCEWRLVAEGRIIVARGDDGQLFGLPKPCDALTVLQDEIIGRPVEGMRDGLCNADLILRFGGGVELQILPDSGGYEAWTLSGPNELIVGRGCD